MSYTKSCIVLYGPIYWVELRGIGIGIGLKHVYNQDSWYWSWIVSNIKTSLGIGLEKISISRLVLVLVLKENWNQDKSWYWSWKKIKVKTSLGLGLEQNKWSRRSLGQIQGYQSVCKAKNVLPVGPNIDMWAIIRVMWPRIIGRFYLTVVYIYVSDQVWM